MELPQEKVLENLRILGQQVQQGVERLRENNPDLYDHITDRLAKRLEFGKRAAPARLQLLLFLVTAEKLRLIGTHTLAQVVRSFYVVTDHPNLAMTRANAKWEDHPGKHLLTALQRSLNQSSKRGDRFVVSIAGHTVSIVPSERQSQARRAQPSTPEAKSSSEVPAATHDPDASAPSEGGRIGRAGSSHSLLEEFWRPHLMGNRPTLIVFGEPMFVRDGDTFSRNIHHNAEHSLSVAHEKQEICWPFMARGAALCAFHLIRWFTKQQIDVDWLGCRNTDQLHKLTDHRFRERANVVVIGSVRSNGILADYQREPIMIQGLDGSRTLSSLPFALREDGIVETQPDRPLREDQLTKSPYEAWSLVGRRNGISEGTITMVAGNFGQVIARIGEFLTNDELFQSFIERQTELKGALLETLPSHFQVPIKMGFYDHGAVAGHYEVGEAWFEGRPRTLSKSVEPNAPPPTGE